VTSALSGQIRYYMIKMLLRKSSADSKYNRNKRHCLAEQLAHAYSSAKLLLVLSGNNYCKV